MATTKQATKTTKNGAGAKTASGKAMAKHAKKDTASNGSVAKSKPVPGSIEAVLNALEYAQRHPVY